MAKLNHEIDWNRVAELILTSREIDRIEEEELFPAKKVLYQFSARGHDLCQVILGTLLTHAHDAVSAYYRSRPLVLTLGLSVEDALSSSLAKSGGFSDGRDIGVVCNLPKKSGAIVLPMSGDVGSQFTPAAGWAQAIMYRTKVLKEDSWSGALAVAHCGDAGVATNGFWSALTMATTLALPLLFVVEDNGFGISVSGLRQTPGGNIAKNLASFGGLQCFDGDGTEPQEAAALLSQAVTFVRTESSPALVRLSVPRLSGHSGQDTQAYKDSKTLEDEKARDPLPKLRRFVESLTLRDFDWNALEKKCSSEVREALTRAMTRHEPSRENIHQFVFSESDGEGACKVQGKGGLLSEGILPPPSHETPRPEGTRINLVTAVRKTLEVELRLNPRVLVFGEDVGKKGGVHAATLGLQDSFGEDRVFDTSLSEEGIIGRAVGMAIAGLLPVPEIQFRKYADPATEQLNNLGTMRWRTANRFAAPVVVRLPGGFAKCGDPWHSVSSEVVFAHAVGWRVAMPSNAEDAVGLLRAALRGNDPVIFFEHRHLLDSAWARRPYPGDGYVLPFGRAAFLREGTEATIISWGAMLEVCENALDVLGVQADLLDMRTISPWDRAAVLSSVQKTRRCLIVHEDGLTAGFGAEIAATVAAEAFFSLDAPVKRLAVRDIPIPYNVQLMDEVVPNVERTSRAIRDLLEE